MNDYKKALGWNDRAGSKPGRLMSWRQLILAVVIPLLIQWAIWYLLMINDPCNNNPGCMAGSISGYSLILIMLPSLLLVLLMGLFEVFVFNARYKTALVINTSTTIAPFLLILIVLINTA